MNLPPPTPTSHVPLTVHALLTLSKIVYTLWPRKNLAYLPFNKGGTHFFRIDAGGLARVVGSRGLVTPQRRRLCRLALEPATATRTASPRAPAIPSATPRRPSCRKALARPAASGLDADSRELLDAYAPTAAPGPSVCVPRKARPDGAARRDWPAWHHGARYIVRCSRPRSQRSRHRAAATAATCWDAAVDTHAAPRSRSQRSIWVVSCATAIPVHLLFLLFLN